MAYIPFTGPYDAILTPPASCARDRSDPPSALLRLKPAAPVRLYHFIFDEIRIDEITLDPSASMCATFTYEGMWAQNAPERHVAKKHTHYRYIGGYSLNL